MNKSITLLDGNLHIVDMEDNSYHISYTTSNKEFQLRSIVNKKQLLEYQVVYGMLMLEGINLGVSIVLNISNDEFEQFKSFIGDVE